MRTAYFDCFAGASGDMILGALIDAGLALEQLQNELAKLRLSHYALKARKVSKKGLAGTQVTVLIEEDHHRHHHRHLADITAIIQQSALPAEVKAKSLAVFQRLAEAEAKVHGTTVDRIHFHEVGAMDAIIDVVGAVAGLALLQVQQVYCSPLHLGTGTVVCAHGTLPVPAPATAELVKGKPVYATGVTGELLTPTGAALLTTLAQDFGPLPPMTVTHVGYGSGTSDPDIPNLLRVSIGHSAELGKDWQEEQVAVLETNIDDMNPQLYEYVIQEALSLKALDVFTTPVQMKKNRAGTLLSIVCAPDRVAAFAAFLLRETTTIGLRWRVENRIKAHRRIETLDTPYGAINVKIASVGEEIVNVTPEYDDCKQAALEQGVPLKQVIETVRALTIRPDRA